jgi:hypothetical protein
LIAVHYEFRSGNFRALEDPVVLRIVFRYFQRPDRLDHIAEVHDLLPDEVEAISLPSEFVSQDTKRFVQDRFRGIESDDPGSSQTEQAPCPRIVHAETSTLLFERC